MSYYIDHDHSIFLVELVIRDSANCALSIDGEDASLDQHVESASRNLVLRLVQGTEELLLLELFELSQLLLDLQVLSLGSGLVRKNLRSCSSSFGTKLERVSSSAVKSLKKEQSW